MFRTFAQLTALVCLAAPAGFPQNDKVVISSLANSDANYRKLREAGPAESFMAENIVLKRDAGAITLRNGTITFLAPVLGRTTMAVYRGDGEFRLDPAAPPEGEHLKKILGAPAVTEAFTRAIFVFSDDTHAEIRKSSGAAAVLDSEAAGILRDFRERMRKNPERPRSMLEAMLSGEAVENIEAEILADLYNPARGQSFSAYLNGRRFTDLRFLVRPAGAFPSLPSPEEVAVINFAPTSDEEGIWYLAHFSGEYKAEKGSTREDKRAIEAAAYAIDSTITSGARLISSTLFRFKAVREGERVLRFDLLPDLRVNSVKLAGSEIAFIQEDRKVDGGFYVVMPEPLGAGKEYELQFQYAGDKVVRKAGAGNFTVGARSSWYPSVNSFADRAKFDLTFRVPKKFTLVSVGKLAGEKVEGDNAITQWVTDTPIGVAGFNFGSFKKKQVTDQRTNYLIEGYATSEPPDYLRRATSEEGDAITITPTRLIDKALAETQGAIQIFTHWFGPSPFGRIALTQQPEFSFGQSWPGLVYLPIAAFIDSTQRLQLLGNIDASMNAFLQEITPHEVAHQWWGHIVGWASYRDQWLSEGFADFSASLYLQATRPKPDEFIKFWERQRLSILTKNNYGRSANDAGPVSMGLRLNTAKNGRAYQNLVYAKGSYVLHMLRMMMTDPKTRDQRFVQMMREFTATHQNKNASTESFKEIAEKYMTPGMDVEGNGKLDWFFDQWIHGSAIPKLQLAHEFKEENGKVLLICTVTQSEVTPNFVTLVPLYAEMEDGIARLGAIKMRGNGPSSQVRVELPRKPKRLMLNYMGDVLERP